MNMLLEGIKLTNSYRQKVDYEEMGKKEWGVF